MKDVSLLANSMGIKFKKKELLTRALTHRSYINENPKFKIHNERLEFLGDAVLELIVTEYLFKNFNNPEGDLTNWRAALVNSEMLASTAKKLKLGEYLLLSKGEARDKGKAREYILANAFEALLGAIYLDGGIETARVFVEKYILIELQKVLDEKLYQDPKSYFQERAQEKLGITPHYKVLDEWGPDHKKQFRLGVYLGNELIAEAEGESKHSAEKKAAAKGLEIKKW
jgi:ribonuclease-3